MVQTARQTITALLFFALALACDASTQQVNPFFPEFAGRDPVLPQEEEPSPEVKRIDEANVQILLRQMRDDPPLLYLAGAIVSGQKSLISKGAEYPFGEIRTVLEIVGATAGSAGGRVGISATGISETLNHGMEWHENKWKSDRSVEITKRQAWKRRVAEATVAIARISRYDTSSTAEELAEKIDRIAPGSLKGAALAAALEKLREHNFSYQTWDEITTNNPETATQLDTLENQLRTIKDIKDNSERVNAIEGHVKSRTDQILGVIEEIDARELRAVYNAEIDEARRAAREPELSPAARALAKEHESLTDKFNTLMADAELMAMEDPNSPELASRIEDIELLQTKIGRNERKQNTLFFKEKTAETRDWFHAGVLLAELTGMPPEDVQTFQLLGEGSLNLVEGIGGMILAGAIDPTGIILTVKGIGMLLSLAQGGQTHQEFVRDMIGKLQQGQADVLEGQKWLGRKIDSLALRVGIVHEDVVALTELVQKSVEDIKDDTRAIRSGIEKVEGRMAAAEERFSLSLRKLSDDEERRELVATGAAFRGLFHNWRERVEGRNLWTCRLGGEKGCSETSLREMERIRKHLGNLAHRLQGTPTRTERNFAEVTEQQAVELLKLGPAERAVLATTLLAWLARENGQPEPNVAPFTDPHRTAMLVNEYLELAKLLPVRNAHGQVIVDRNIPERMCPVTAKVVDEARAMRDALPMAWRIYLKYATAAQQHIAQAIATERGKMRRVRGAAVRHAPYFALPGLRRVPDFLFVPPEDVVSALRGRTLHRVGMYLSTNSRYSTTRTEPHSGLRDIAPLLFAKDRERWLQRLTADHTFVWRTRNDKVHFLQLKEYSTGYDPRTKSTIVLNNRVRDFSLYYALHTPSSLKNDIFDAYGNRDDFKIWPLLARFTTKGYKEPYAWEGVCIAWQDNAFAGCNYEEWWKRKVEDFPQALEICDEFFSSDSAEQNCNRVHAAERVGAKIVEDLKKFDKIDTHAQVTNLERFANCPDNYKIKKRTCIKLKVGVRSAIVAELRARQRQAWTNVRGAVPADLRAQWARAKLAVDTALALGYGDAVAATPEFRRVQRVVKELPAPHELDGLINRIENTHPRAYAQLRTLTVDMIFEEFVSEASVDYVHASAKHLARLAGSSLDNGAVGAYYSKPALAACETETQARRWEIAEELRRRALQHRQEDEIAETKKKVARVPIGPSGITELTTILEAHRQRVEKISAAFAPPARLPSCAEVRRAPAEHFNPRAVRPVGKETALDLGLPEDGGPVEQLGSGGIGRVLPRLTPYCATLAATSGTSVPTLLGPE